MLRPVAGWPACESQNNALDTILHRSAVEIEKESESEVGRSQIRDDLRLVNKVDASDSLQFDQNAVGHDQIDPLTWNGNSSVTNTHRPLADKGNSSRVSSRRSASP